MSVMMASSLEKTQLQDVFSVEPGVDSPNFQEEAPDFWCLAVSMHKDYPNVKLTENEVTFGRAQKCTVQVAHPAVSGLHFVVSRSDDGVVKIQDKSSNGTFVKGEKLGKGKSLIISDGTEVVLMKSDKDRIAYIFYFMQRILDQDENAKQGGPEHLFDIRETLGSGGFATVKLCIHRRTGKKFAIKCIEKAKAIQCAPHRSQAWMDEINILRGLDHPNIVKISGLFQTHTTIYIVLELLRGGDLFDAFFPNVQKREGWPEAKCFHVVRQIVRALAYLHGRKIVHRDLKLENILLAEGTDTEWPTIKLTDFGLARIVDESNACITKVGTELYCAPEVAHQGEGTAYDKQVDVWALGIVAHILLVGVQPHIPKHQYTQEQFDKLNYRQPFWNKVSPEAKDLVKRMLRVDPVERVTVAEIPHHDWMLKNIGDASSSSSASTTVSASATEETPQITPPKVDDFANSMQSILNGSSAAMNPADMVAVMEHYVSNPKLFPNPSAEEAHTLFAHAQRSARQLVRAAAASDDRIKRVVENGSDGPAMMEVMGVDQQVSMLRDFFSAAALGAYQMSLAASASSSQVPASEPRPFGPDSLSHFPAGALFVPVPVPVPEEASASGAPSGEAPHILFESLMSSAAQQLKQFSNAAAAAKKTPNHKRRRGDVDDGKGDMDGEDEGNVQEDGDVNMAENGNSEPESRRQRKRLRSTIVQK